MSTLAPTPSRLEPRRTGAPAAARARRALFVLSDLGGGGAERVVLTLLGALGREQVEPELFLVKREGAYLAELPRALRLTSGMEPGRLLPALPRVLARLVAAARRADVVVGALELDSTYLAWAASRIARRPLLAWAHVDLEMHLRRMPRRHRALARLVYPRLERVVVPSSGLVGPLVRATGARQAGVAVVANPIDLAAVRARGQAPLDALLGRAFAAPVVLGVGRLSAQKGFDVLLRAHARLRSEGAGHHLVVLGEGPERDALLALARSLGVQDSVFLPGFVADPYPAMRRARTLALPSRREGFGMVLLEAMALGTPVVTTDSSGPAELVANGRAGLVVPTDDVAALAAALGVLLADGEARDALVRQGLRRADDYAVGAIAPAWAAMLHEGAHASR